MSDRGRLRELALLFLRLGTVGFGGPAAHIALMEEEVVRRRGWLRRDEFLDLVGAVNLLPGPNSTELAIHVGRRRAGTAGLLVAGVLMNIILAFVIFAGIAWLASPIVGIKIDSVVPDSPAEAAGLKPGEALYALDGKPYQFLLGESILMDLSQRPGEAVTLTIVGTDGTKRDVDVTLRDADAIARGEPHPIAAPFSLDRFRTGRLIDEAAAAAVAH